MYRVCIIGAGNIASKYDEQLLDARNCYTHAASVCRSSGLNLTAICDIDFDRAQRSAGFWGIRAYKNYREMLLTERCDIVIVATSPETHYEIVKSIVLKFSPRLILVEKPFAETVDDARELLDLSAERAIPVWVSYLRRSDDTHIKIKKRIAGRELGNIQHVTAFYVRGVRHNGCHVVNTLRYFLGEPVSSRLISGKSGGSINGDPSVDFILEFERGEQCVCIALDKSGYHFSIFEIDIIGTDGRITLKDEGRTIWEEESVDHELFSGFKMLKRNNRPFMPESYGKALLKQCCLMEQYLNGDLQRCSIDATEALQDMIIIEKLLS